MADQPRDETSFVGHEPCPACGSRDNLARYASGRGHCHGCGHNEFPDDYDGPRRPANTKSKMSQPYEPYQGDLGDETFTRAYGIKTDIRRDIGISLVPMGVEHLGVDYPRKPCVTFDYRLPDGTLWGQKIRYKLPEGAEDGKTFRFPHAKGSQAAPMYLMHKWGQGSDRRSLTIWEGEGDCAAYYQVTGGKYPCVSLPNGAKGAEDTIRAWYEWIDQFDKIVLVFDGDATGREWSKRVAALLPPGKAFIGEVPGHKDAREALLADDTKAVQQAYWNATEFKPDGIFTVADLREQALVLPTIGIPWKSPTLTSWTYGRREGEAYYLAAGNAVGKTDFCTENIEHDVNVLRLPTAVIYMEQPPVETVKRVAGKAAHRLFHLPPDEGGYTQDELTAAIDRLASCDHLVFGGNFAATTWEDLKQRLRYLSVSKGIKSFWIDNLTALVDPANERQSVETIVKELALLMQELRTFCVMVCHLRTAENGPSHEEGGQVRLSQFKGSRAIGAFAHYAFGLERNTVHEDPDMRLYTLLRCVKDRFTGRAGGNTLWLKYNPEDGMLAESDAPPETASHGFQPVDTGGLDL
ncbi:DnaB-like helicase C-terminal domain-containing protein [Sphingomonas asaccharolytica]|uniref:DnaB-like helicase C-terminal domain-containing protein n=1 Tax=Sphingomonas asaccharolytica TaxID=40681 RepID=UPI001470B694|nr:DnaB-like helicase C-terminal domain-containing protein [Sphingomonas asaccharolytica]